MLAAKPKRGQDFDTWVKLLRLPLWETPKIDGIRCVTLDMPGDHASWQCMPLTRNMKGLQNRFVARTIGEECPPGLDGELVTFTEREVGDVPDPYYETSSAILSEEGMPRFKYMVFDHILPETKNLGYLDRLRMLEKLALPSFCEVLHPSRINTIEELRERVNERMDQGFEGCCLRTGCHPYKFGRSSIRQQGLVAVKMYEENDARVTGCEALMRNIGDAELDARGHMWRPRRAETLIKDDLLGKLIGKDVDTGQEVTVGSGFTYDQRVKLWNMKNELRGRLFKYRHQPYGAKEDGKRRLPVFVGFRDETTTNEDQDQA